MTELIPRALVCTICLLSAGPTAVRAADTRQLTVFTVGIRDVSDEVFVVATDDPELIERCREQLGLPVSSRDLHVNGRLLAGHGGANLGWSWHLDPDAWSLAEVSIELCDGVPGMVEANLDDWLESVGRFCPWSSYIAAERSPWPVRDPAAVAVRLEPAVSGLDRPLAVVEAGDGSGRLFVAEQGGRIRVVREGQLRPDPLLDISDRVLDGGSEQGLLGLAFSPRFVEDRALYVNYTDLDGDTVVARYRVRADDPERADPASEEVVLTLAQPYSNHNGGHLLFGPGGMLWVGTGDGGSAGDPQGNAQDPQSLLGKMLRLDVSGGGKGYEIPDDNPFVGDSGTRDEIWALGLRNPWRYAFDPVTGDLFIADVGQRQWEEIDVEGAASPGGANWGWNVMEGLHCDSSSGCDRTGLRLPAAEYPHSEGCSVTGGVVVRGSGSPAVEGVYLFADFCSGRIWALTPGGRSGRIWATDLQAGTLLRVLVGRAALVRDGAADRRVR